MSKTADDLRAEILQLTAEYHAAAFAERPFTPGVSFAPPSTGQLPAPTIISCRGLNIDFVEVARMQ